MAGLLEVANQLAGALERLDLTDQLAVELGLGVADVVALLVLDLLARERLHEQVPAHPDVPVDAPHRKHDLVLRNARYQAMACW